MIVKYGWLVAVSVMLAGCGSPTESPSGPERPPLRTGQIVRAGYGLMGGDGRLQIHVKSDSAEKCGTVFSVDDNSWIGDSRSGSTRRAGVHILEIDARVEVWFGVELNSCPAQSYADAVNRIE